MERRIPDNEEPTLAHLPVCGGVGSKAEIHLLTFLRPVANDQRSALRNVTGF